MKYWVIIFLIVAGNIFAQTNTTNSPIVQELSKLALLQAQTSYLRTINNPTLLLNLRQKADIPNYEGNAYAELHKTFWLRVVRGEPVLKN